jgi:hypothetical protein
MIMESAAKRYIFGVVLPVIIITSVNPAQAQTWRGRITKDGDVIVVHNPRDPMFKGPILTLEEDWTIGGESASGEYALAMPWSIAVDKDGYLYVLDVKDASVKVFDKTGKFARKIGRRGQGPGEIEAAFSIIIPINSNSLVVCDRRSLRLAFFSLDGQFQKNLPLRGMSDVSAIDSQGNIYLDTTDLQENKKTLKKMNPDMSDVLAVIFDHPTEESHNPFKPRERWIVDDKNRLIYGNANSYEIRYFEPDGRLSRKILRDYNPLKVSKNDIDEFLKRGAPPGFNPTYDFSSHHAAYRSFFVDDQGHLFVQTWERTVDNRQDIYDIFDSEGKFIGRIAMPRHEDLINPTVRIFKGGKFYTIEPDTDGYEVVKRYSVNWLIEGANRDKRGDHEN